MSCQECYGEEVCRCRTQSVSLSAVDVSVVEAIAEGVLRALRASYAADSQAETQVKAIAQELQAASNALLQAAEILKQRGLGTQANAAFLAHRSAARAVEELLGA